MEIMEEYSKEIECLKEECTQLSESLASRCQEKVTLLRTLKNTVSTEMLNILCTEMVARVQEHMEQQNSSMQETLVVIDEDLNQSASAFEEISTYRSKFLELYNSVTCPKLCEEEAMQTCIEDGSTMETVAKIQTDAQDIVSDINLLRTQHETLFNKIQEVLYAMIETSFEQMEKQVMDQNEATCQKVNAAVSECEKELTESGYILQEMSTIKDKIQGILCLENAFSAVPSSQSAAQGC